MSIPISGTLYDPYGHVARFADIKFVTLQGSGDVIETSNATFRTDENGTYAMDVQFGRFAVYMRFNGNNGSYNKIQAVTVNSDTIATTLGELLAYTEPLTPDEILIVQALVNEAIAAKDDAQAAALQAAIDEASAAASAAAAQASATEAANSSALLAPVPLNGGVWASGQQFTAYNQYMIYSGEAYSPLPATTLPYTVGATPDLGFVYQIALNDHSKLANRNAVGAHDASAVDTNSGLTVQEYLDANALSVESLSDNLEQRQNWFDSAKNSITTNDRRVLYRRGPGADEDIYVYINHKSNQYQRWELTRGPDGFDNNVATNANGNMWMLNKVSSVMVGPVDSVNGSESEMIKSGTWTISSDDIRITDGYAETTVFGKAIFLYYVARNDSGIANIYIDGVLFGQLDQYSPSTGGAGTLVKIADDLENTSHVVRVATTGTKNPLSISLIVRVRTITGVGLQDFDAIGSFSEFTAPMDSGSDVFKIERAAAELAVSSTYLGNTVWSGAYHKYCYPTVADNQKIYVDGALVSFLDIPTTFSAGYDVKLLQDLVLANGSNPIANISMTHHFNSDRCNVKYSLEWTQSVYVDRSYQTMWPTRANNVMLGDMQNKYVAYKTGSYINVYQPAHNAIAWQNVDGWISGFKSNNEYGMRFSSDPAEGYAGMYMWDRSTDFKIYLRKFKGNTAIGDVWQVDTDFFIGHLPDTSKVFNFKSNN